MSGASKSLMAEVVYNGQKMRVVDVLNAIQALHPEIPLTTSEAAIFLRTSVTKMERMRKEGGGPTYSQGGALGAKGTNQTCYYLKGDLIAWLKGNQVSNSLQAAVRKGQAFATIFDLAEQEAFYVDERGAVESMVVENLLGTVVERVGIWSQIWMTPVEAASRAWSSLDKHNEFAASVRVVLSNALRGVDAAVEATGIAKSLNG